MKERKLDETQLIDTLGIGGQTLVGYMRDIFPIINGGNCFSLCKEDGTYIQIVNFGVENLEHLLNTKQIEWPIKVLPITEKIGVILDERVPPNYYWDRFCEVCCPFQYLPTTQKLKHWDGQLKGTEVVHDGFITYKMNNNGKKLKGKWKVELAEPQIIFSPYIPIIEQQEMFDLLNSEITNIDVDKDDKIV